MSYHDIRLVAELAAKDDRIAQLEAEIDDARQECKDALKCLRILWGNIMGDVPGPPPWFIACTEMVEKVDALEAERDALVAAKEKTDEAFERFAAHHGPCCHEHNSSDETAPGECSLCDIDRAARKYEDFAAILTARDARMKREGALEALRGLPRDEVCLFDNTHPNGGTMQLDIVHYADVLAAIAALETPRTKSPETSTSSQE